MTTATFDEQVAPPEQQTESSAARSTATDILAVLPAQGDWSEEEYLWLSGRSNRLVEFSEGKIEVVPMPTEYHQTISRRLFLLFLAFMQQIGGEVFYAPLRVRLPSGKFREPDLLLLLDANDPRRGDAFWAGADLVVEIVSPDDPKRDTVNKRKEYAEAGIPEYWIVNPIDATITVLRLDGNVYAEHGVFQRGDTATSVLLADFRASVDATFSV